MKTLLLSLLLLPAISFCQATTETEYNYMKKGYRSVEEQGLDVKKGYAIEELSSSNPNMKFTLLKRSDSSYAGIIIKYSESGAFGYGTNVSYWAIPAVNTIDKKSFGWDLFRKDIDSMTFGVSKAILNWMSYRLSWEMSRNKGN